MQEEEIRSWDPGDQGKDPQLHLRAVAQKTIKKEPIKVPIPQWIPAQSALSSLW